MPNWSSVTYKVTGKKEKVESLYNMLTELEKMKEPYVENGFGNLWLGCLVEKMGRKWQDVGCRGEVTTYEMGDDVLTMNMETAWEECKEVRALIESFFCVKIFYYEEETGMEIFRTNDFRGEFFPELYVTIDDNSCEWEYHKTDEELLDYINEARSLKFESVEEARESLDRYNRDHEDAGFHIYEIEKVTR